MTDRKALRCAVPLLLLFLLMQGGCGITGQSPATRLYMLNPVSDTDIDLQFSERSQFTIVGIDPVEFPAYLERAQMIVRQSRNRYEMAEFDRWAESLQSNFERVLVENLNGKFQDAPFAVVQWRRYLDIDYTLRVKVTRLESDVEGHASLGVVWMLFDESGEKLVMARVSNYSEQSVPGDYEKMAAAQSRALEAFSRDVAEAIQRLPR